MERKSWRDKERDWKALNERLYSTVDAYKKELQWLKEECDVNKFFQVVRDSEQMNVKGRLIVDQVVNYKAKKLTWRVVQAFHTNSRCGQMRLLVMYLARSLGKSHVKTV